MDEASRVSRPHKSGSSTNNDTAKRARSSTSGAAIPNINSDPQRGFTPTSTAYSSTSRVAYPNTAGASVASSHATASANGNDESFTTPVLNRNQSLADKMPKSTTSTRSGRDREGDSTTKSKRSSKSSRDDDNGRSEKKSRRDRTESKSSSQSGEKSRSVNGGDEGQAGDDVVGAGPSNPARPPEHQAMSSHVQDQFPGQFPSESSAPYRPPLAASEGGPGLAAEYYGDVGESVSEQPGFRKHSPSLIIGQEPHLLPASSVAAPPPEPSASGGVGAAASFFSGEFDADEVSSSYAPHASSTSSAPSRPNAAAAPSNSSPLGSAAIGTAAAMSAAAGYAMGNHSSSSHQQDTIPTSETFSGSSTVTGQRPQSQSQSQSQGSYYSASSRPPTSGSRPSHADNIPIYAAAAAGVAGLAGAAMHNSGHSSAGQASSTQQYAAPTTPRHRHRGPLGALVDFVRDPEGVAQFEEYSEYVGICRGCFEPGSSPRDAPRRHRMFNRKRSDERIGRTSRVEKNRRDSSGDEKRDRNSPSWLSGGIAGYGLGKMGESLFKQKSDFDDTYSVQSGRYSPESGRRYKERTGSDNEARRRRASGDALETGVIGGGKYPSRNSDIFEAAALRQSNWRQGKSRSRSRSRDRISVLSGAAAGAAIGSSTGDRSKRRSRNESESDSKRTSRRRKEKKAEKRGFFSFGSNSSSSSLDKAHARNGKSSKSKSDDKKAEAALLGLGAAAAALAAADSRSGHRKNGIKELVGRKETRDERLQRPQGEDAGWEDEEDHLSEDGSIDSGLAFGGESDGSSGHRRDRRRRSEMSGKGSLPGRRSSWDDGRPTATDSNVSPDRSSKPGRPSPPLQYVDPEPVPDFQHLDERMGESEPFQTRPPLVSHPSEETAFHQPQPRSTVSSSVYATQIPHSSSYTEPPSASERTREAQIDLEGVKLSRSATLPATFESEEKKESNRRRKSSVKDDLSMVSGVRFALPEDDKDERREKRRRRRESEQDYGGEKESRAAEDEARRERKSASKKSSEARNVPTDDTVTSSGNVWATPAAVGLAGAAIGAAAVAEGRKDSRAEETKEERRERRRREKQRDEEEDDTRRKERRRREKEADVEDRPSKSERREDGDRGETREERKTRRRAEKEERARQEQEDETGLSSKPRVSFGKLPRRADSANEEDQTDKQDTSSKKEAYQHEDYSSFFTPAIDDTSDQQVKISGANADADISFDQSPNFGIGESREIRSEYPPADRSAPKFPWQVPPLRLLYPTPPSSRTSTPIIEPREVPEPEPQEIREIVPKNDVSSTNVEQHDSSRGQDPLPSMAHQINDRYTDPPSDDDVERWRRRKPKKIPLSIDQENPPADADSYGNDNSFAAVLAASAEDAGFDPAIVIADPKYRRRDSPPGSDERNIPGSFDERDDEPSLGNGNSESSTSRRQSPPEDRDDDAIVKNIISQVEAKDSSKAGEGADDDNVSLTKSKKSKKSKKGSNRSSIKDEAFEDQDSQTADDKNLPNEEPMGDSRSIASSAHTYDNDHEASNTRKGNGDSASTVLASVAAASAVGAATNTKAGSRKKGSLWDRVLGKGANTSSAPDEESNAKSPESSELSRKDSKKGKKSKRKSVQSEASLENGGENGTDGGQDEESKEDRSVNSLPASVAQYLTKESDPEQSQEPVTESFLGERPDPPPPPDIEKKSEEPFGMATTINQQDPETHTPSVGHSRWPSEISTSDGPFSPKTVSSPTAVPIHFRRPTLPKSRSSSQSPLSSTRTAEDGPPPHSARPRPRSTQFENSKEYRPLWLVERNQSRQDVPRDEIYPPLPSSHSTSRDSSLDPFNRQAEDEILESGFEPRKGGHGILEGPESRALDTELLDSQQATPTAASFQRISATHDQASPLEHRSDSPTKHSQTDKKPLTSDLAITSLAAVAAGTAAYAVHEPERDLELSTQERPLAKSSELSGDLASRIRKVEPVALDDAEDFSLKKKKKKSKKGKPSDDRFDTEQPDVAAKDIPVALDQRDDFSSTLPIQRAVDQETIEKLPTDDVLGLAEFATPEPELTIGDVIRTDATEETGVMRSQPEHVGRNLHSLGDLGSPSKMVETDKPQKASSNKFTDLMMPLKESSLDSDKVSTLSPPSTPLPRGDDSDLFNKPLQPDVDSSLEPSTTDQVNPTHSMSTLAKHDERLGADGASFISTVRDRSQDERNSTPAVIGGDSPGTSQAVRDIVSTDRDLVDGSSRHEEVNVSSIAEVGNDGAAEDDFMGFGSKKKAKKGKKSKQSLPIEPLPDLSDTKGDVEVNDPSAADLVNDDAAEDEFTGFTSKKKGKKGKKGEQDAPIETLPDLSEGPREVIEVTDPQAATLDNDDAAEDEFAGLTSKKKGKKGKKSKQSLPAEYMPDLSDGSKEVIGLSKTPDIGVATADTLAKLNERQQDQVSTPTPDETLEDGRGIERPEEAPSQDNNLQDEEDLKSLRSKKKNKKDKKKRKVFSLLDDQDTLEPEPVNRELPENSDHDPSSIVDKSPEENKLDGEDRPEVVEGEPALIPSEIPNVALGAESIPDDGVQFSPATGRALNEDPLEAPAVADLVDPVITSDKAHALRQADDLANKKPGDFNSGIDSTYTGLDQMDERQPEDEGFDAFPVKKSKKDKKGKKAKKEEPPAFEEPTSTKSIETVPDTLALTDEARKASADEDISNFVRKASKRDKKGKKKKATSSTAIAPVDQFEDDLGPEQVDHAAEASATVVAPVSIETNDVPFMTPKSMAPMLDEADVGDWNDAPVKTSTKDKKSKKSSIISTTGLQTSQLAGDAHADQARSLPEDRILTTILLEDTKPTAYNEVVNGVDLAERNLKEEQDDEEFGIPKTKKGKKKAKKSKPFSWDDDVDQEAKIVDTITQPDCALTTATGGSDGVNRELFNGAQEDRQEQALHGKVLASEEAAHQDDAKKGKDFSWGAYKSKDSELSSAAATDLRDDHSSKPPPQTFEEILDKPQPQMHARDGEAPSEEKIESLSERIGQERSISFFHIKADAVETPGFERTQSLFDQADQITGPIVSPVQKPSDVPQQLTFDDIVEPSMVEEPQEPMRQETLPGIIDELSPTREVEDPILEPESATFKKSKKSKKSKKAKTIALEHVEQMPVDRGQDKRDETSPNLEAEGNDALRQASVHTDLKGERLDEAATNESKDVHKSVQINDEPEIIERVYSQSPEPSAHRKSTPPDTPLSAGSVDMLDPDEQREYNEEYRKQLEKELSPLRENSGALDISERNLDDSYERAEPERQPGVFQSEDQDILQTNLGNEPVESSGTLDISPHHSLSAIPEEGDLQPNSSDQQPASQTGDGPERKKSKKGKKSKQTKKPVIWEDDTATQGITDNAEQPLNDHEDLGGPVEDIKPQEEGRSVYHDLPSPSRGSPSAARSPKFDEAAEDYFAVKPRVGAEKDVGAAVGLDQPSPEQLENLPDWSSGPKEVPVVERGHGSSIAEQVSHRETSPFAGRRPSDDVDSHDRARHESVGEIAMAVAAGAGIVGATAISKGESKKAKKASKKSKRRNEVDPGNNEKDKILERDKGSFDIPERHESNTNADRMLEQYNEPPSQSPDRLSGSRHVSQDPQQEEQPNYRDSAIQIADSPIIPVPELVHRPQHDSGYPATEASPVINDSKSDSQEEHGVVDPYTDPRVGTTGFYHEDEARPMPIATELHNSTVESHDEETSEDRRRSRRRRRRRESNVTYDSDDSNDSGYDRQRRLRKIRQSEELREPSPVSSTTKNRSSVLFDSSPSDRQALEQQSVDTLGSDQKHEKAPPIDASEFDSDNHDLNQPPKSIFGGPLREEDRSRSRSPANSDAPSRRHLEKISEDSLEDSPLARKGKRDISKVGSPDSGVRARRTSHELAPVLTGVAAGAVAMSGSEDPFKRLHKPSKDDDDHSVETERSTNRDRQDRARRLSNQSNTSTPVRDSDWRRQALKSPDSIHAIIRTPPDQVRSSSGQSIRSSGTPPLRRVDRSVSGDLRGASKEDAKRRAKLVEAGPAVLGIAAETIASSSTYDPLTDKGKNRGDMADVYEGEGRRGQSPMSPTRPASMRKRQSMQFADLEQRFEQLAADHRSLQSAKLAAERRLDEQTRDHSQQRQTYEEALQDHKSYLAEKDSELSRLHEILDGFKRQVSELSTVNEELQTSRGLDPDRVGDQSFQILAGQHETTKKELEDLREQHTRLANDHEDMLEREIEAVRQEKDYELRELIVELDHAKEQIKMLQQQIAASADDYVEHDEDYFESKCTALCQHVQQWVLRFSKFSDSHACRLVGELGDDTLSDLFDDAILDGTEVDDYLQDRIKRRDVFMSVVMSRIFDFIFRRYLFGLDREQRKKLKDLEATLTDVGPQSAVHKWRSTTLTLLSSRPEFADQREEDTEGVVDSIYQTLAAILPPKKDLLPQITDSLRRVVSMAVDLHIEMRLQRAEFQMLPPLKPQFDPNTGELVRKVPFNAAMMNERSGNTESNEQLQEEGAVIRMVLFPLVVKNSDEEEQIVVCPAQVIVAKDEPKKRVNGKQVRVMSAQGARSETSFVGTEDTRMSVEGGMF